MEEINEKLHLQVLNFDSTKREQWVRERKPFSVLFELTPKCNMNCIHCYLQNSHTSDDLSFEQIISILNILHEEGIIFLTFTGGEIFTRKDFMDIYLYAKKRGFLVELFTNGSLITDDIIKVLRKYPPLLVDISLYGENEETYYQITQVHNMYYKVIANCKKLVDAGIRVSLKSPILQCTLKQISGMKEIAKGMNIPFVYSFEIMPTIDKNTKPCTYQVELAEVLKHEFLDYYDQISHGIRKAGDIDINSIKKLAKCEYVYDCNIAQNSFVIDYQGNMLPCMKLRHHGKNILKEKFSEIWKEFGIYKKIKASNDYKCKKCESRFFCDICPAEMNLIYGNAEFRPSDACLAAEIRKKFYNEEITFEEAIKLASQRR